METSTWICGHEVPRTKWREFWHGLLCVKVWLNNWRAASRKDELDEDCAIGCGCDRDPWSPNYKPRK